MARSLTCRALAAYAAVAAVAWAGGSGAWLRADSAVMVAAALFAVPLVLGPATSRRRLLRVRSERVLPGLADGLGVALFLIPLFLGALWWLGRLQPVTISPIELGRLAAYQLLLVALPEEFFFRGYLQRTLAALDLPRVRVLGVRCGLEVPLAAALFALAHLAAGGGAATLLTFFPGLVFGWLYARRRSLAGPVLFHALCNLSMLACPGLQGTVPQ